MPPLKQPLSIMCLSIGAIISLIRMCFTNIEKSRQQPTGLCQESIDILQGELLKKIPLALWDSVLQGVQDSIRREENFSDHALLFYSIFVHEDRTRVFAFNVLYLGSETVVYWERHLHSLKNVVELDMFSLETAETLRILPRIGSICRNLQKISFMRQLNAENLQVLASCTELRSITIRQFDRDHAINRLCMKVTLELFPKLVYYNYHCVGEYLMSLEVKSPLKLRSITERNCSVQYISRIVELCPDIERLVICINTNADCAQIFDILSSSSLKISELEVSTGKLPGNFCQCEESVGQFFKLKGIYLQKLRMDLYKFPRGLDEVITQTCVNLADLHLIIHYGLAESTKPINVQQELSLTSLQNCIFSANAVSDLSLLATLLRGNSNVTSLEIKVDFSCTLDDLVSEIFNSTKLENLVHLELGLIKTATETAFRAIYNRCPCLREMCITTQSFDVVIPPDFYQQICREVKENNLDFKFTEMYIRFCGFNNL